MRRPVGLLLIGLVAFFTASCFQYAARPMSLAEAARSPGDTACVAGGLSGGTGMLYSLYGVVTWEHGAFSEVRCDRFAAGQGVVSLEAGKDRLKGVASLGFGVAQMTDTFWRPNGGFRGNPAGISRRAFPLEFSSGCKIGIGSASALRLSAGTDFCFFMPDSAVKEPLIPLPSVDAIFLHDLGSRWTAGAGIGLRGLQFNAVHHLPLGKRVAGNIAANLLYYGWPIRWSSKEPRITDPFAAMLGITVRWCQ